MNIIKIGFFSNSKMVWSFKKLKTLFLMITVVCLFAGCGMKENQVFFDSESSELENQVENGNGDELEEPVCGESTEEQNGEMVENGEGSLTESLGETKTLCYVYACGAIANPGVYEVAHDTRVCEVIQYAGGLTEDAATTCINQALAVYDGLMLVIPTVTQWENGEFVLDENGFPIQVPKETASGKGNPGSVVDDGKVNINEATVEQLCTLPGVGASRAESIVAYRQEHGAFQCIEDIKKVSGIKDGLFEKIKEKIKV